MQAPRGQGKRGGDMCEHRAAQVRGHLWVGNVKVGAGEPRNKCKQRGKEDMIHMSEESWVCGKGEIYPSDLQACLPASPLCLFMERKEGRLQMVIT